MCVFFFQHAKKQKKNERKGEQLHNNENLLEGKADGKKADGKRARE